MFRAIVRNPTAYVSAATTLAVAIGAVVAMFSVYDRLVLHPMDVSRPGDLVDIQTINPRVNTVPATLSWTRFDNSLRHARSFTHVAAWDVDSVSLTLEGQPAQDVPALRVSSDFFAALGVTPLEGRLFTDEDDRPNGRAVCVLSSELWESRFGGRPIVGETIRLNGRPAEVIGILPPWFTPPWSDRELFLPRLPDTSTMMPENVRTGSSFLSVIARLEPGVSLEQAQAELDGLAAAYAAQFAGFTDAANSTVAKRFTEVLTGSNRQTLATLLIAVGAVLLVACANASTLFLGRLLARQRETAVRQALGASRSRVVRGFLLESLALSLAGGIGGMAIAWGLLRGVTVAVASLLPPGTTVGLSGTGIAAALVVVVVTALLVGIVPALYVTRPGAAPLVSFARGESTTVSGRRLRALLVLGEVALSSALLIGAALLLASLLRLERSSPGFEPAGTAAGAVALPPARYNTAERQAAFLTQVLETLAASPGVEQAAAVFGLPLGGGFSFHQYVVDGRPVPPPSERPRAGIRLVTEAYFDVMKIRLEQGRAFTAHDRQGTRLVCIVNETMARRVFNGRALGQVIRRGRDAGLAYEVVGVVEDVSSYGLRRPPVDEVFYPLRQLPWPQFTLVARAAGDPASLRKAMEAAVASVDPLQPVARFTTMTRLFDRSMGSERAMASITLAFAGVALFMAVVGLHAVLAQAIASRTTEIAIRVALGAGRARILRSIVVYGMAIVSGGLALGLAGAAAGAGYLASHLYSVDPRDPWIFGGVPGLFGLIALLACLPPAWRAARLDPNPALWRG